MSLLGGWLDVLMVLVAVVMRVVLLLVALLYVVAVAVVVVLLIVLGAGVHFAQRGLLVTDLEHVAAGNAGSVWRWQLQL